MRTSLVYVLAAFAEIAGCFSFWAWLRGQHSMLLLLPGMASRGIVDVGIVRRWWRRALQAPSTTEGFWTTVALELWAQQFIDGRHNGSG